MPIRVARTALAAAAAVAAFCSQAASGATKPGAEAGAGAGAVCTLGQLVELKVTMDGRRPMVPVSINGHDERFLVDSGAFFSNISAGKAAELGLRLENLPVNFTVRGIGGEVNASLTTVDNVGLAGLALKKVHFVVGGSEVGRGAGLLGQNVLGLADVEYDLAHGAVRLLRAHQCRDEAQAYWAKGRPVSSVTIEAMDDHQRHTIGAITINGIKMRAMFDTGADGTVLSMAAAARLGFKPGGAGMVAAFGGGLGKKSVPAYLIPIDSIKLSDQEEIRRTHLRVEDIGFSSDHDLLIGADFFLSHRVYIANAQHRLFFTYEGGPIFGTTTGGVIDTEGKAVTIAAAPTADPTDAAGFSRRGAAAMARRDYPHAIADLDKAVAMAPTEAGYFFLRAQARMFSRQPLLAMDDIDQTLKLDPGNAEARLARASIRLSRHDRAAAEQDVASVDTAAAPAADARLTLAGMYGALGQPAKAEAQYDLWLRYHPDDRRKPTALNGACWTRAQLNTELAKALSDCDAALKARPDAAAYLDSRGLVRLRMGDYAKAIGDYDAALTREPKFAWALYGRGLAKQHAGDKAGGDADLAAATAIDAGVVTRAKAIGL